MVSVNGKSKHLAFFFTIYLTNSDMRAKFFLYIAGGIEIWYALFAGVGSYRVWNDISRLRAGNLPGVPENIAGLIILIFCALLLTSAAIGLLGSQKWAFHLSSLISILIIFLVVVGLIFSRGTTARLPLTVFNASLPLLLVFSLLHPQTRKNIFPEKYTSPNNSTRNRA